MTVWNKVPDMSHDEWLVWRTNEDTSCAFQNCTKPFTNGIKLIGVGEAYEYLKDGAWMHMECYIKHCVREILKEAS